MVLCFATHSLCLITLQENFEPLELLPMLLLGVIGGLLGSFFTALNGRLAAWRNSVLAPYGKRGRLWESLAVALLTSTVSFLLPMLTSCQVGCRAQAPYCIVIRVRESHSALISIVTLLTLAVRLLFMAVHTLDCFL
eukprot:GHRR01032100.1.p1 GENE.GHRR01032100.1~~GHRR01032100.1.p1  ORF type:complete len:137 (+),score=31.07 GHRR01032100.1:231-641(+)